MDLIEALSQKYQGDTWDIIGEVLKTPQHAVTALFSEGDYMENLAKGVDPSELLGVDGFTGIAADLVLDPLNLLMGAGAITKLAKVGKVAKIAEGGTKALEELTKGGKIIEEIADAAKIGKYRIYDIPEILDIAKRNADVVAKVRGEGASFAELGKIYEEVKGNQKALAAFDEMLNTGKSFQNYGMTRNFIENAPETFLEDMVKSGKIDDYFLNFFGRGTATSREFNTRKIEQQLMAEWLGKKLNSANPETAKLAKKMIENAIGGDITPSRMDKFVEWATMSKLWGLSTVVKNTIGNSFQAALQVPEKFAAGVVDAIVSGIRGTERSVYAREALAEMAGIKAGFKTGVEGFWKILKDPEAYIREGTKISEFMGYHGAIGRGPFKNIDRLVNSASKGKFGLNVGELIRAPGRLLTGEDVLFRETLKSMNLNALATRQALKEGLSGSKLAERVTEIVTGKDAKLFKELSAIAEDRAAERIFQQGLTGMVSTLNEFRAKHPIARLFVPFFKTPVNLLKQSAQRIPGVPLVMPSFWKALKGTSPFLKGMSKQEFIATMAARQLSGTALLGMAMYGASEGLISGLGPKSKAKRNAMRMAGWQPQSIHIGDKWVSYRGFEPISSWMRTSADLFEGHKASESVDQLTMKGVFSYMKQFSENPFLMGVNSIFEGLSDPDTKATDLFAGLAVGSTVPNIIQQWNRTMIDPVLRDPKNVVSKIGAKLPGTSKLIKPRYDIFGQPITRDIPYTSLFGFNISLDEKDKVFTELARLGMGIGKPSREVNGYVMSDDEYERFYILKGGMLKNAIERIVNYQDWERIDDESKKKILSKIIRDVNRTAKAQEFYKYYRR